MTAPIGGRSGSRVLEPFKPTYTKTPKQPKPDVLTEYQKQMKRENKLHASWLSWVISTVPFAPKMVLWLFRRSLPKKIKINDIQNLKVPKWLPLNVRQAYACHLADYIAKRLQAEKIATLADLSTIVFPNIYCSERATETLRLVMEDKMKPLLQADITIGVYGSEISPLFLDVFNRLQPKHNQLTINAPCDLTRLIQSLTHPTHLRLSTALDNALKTMDIQHLIARKNLTKVSFKKPHAMAQTTQLSQKTWKNLEPWLNLESLEVIIEPFVGEPKEESTWLKRSKELKLKFTEV